VADPDRAAFTLRYEPNLGTEHTALSSVRRSGRNSITRSGEDSPGDDTIDAILSWLREGRIETALVFTKKGLVDNWMREFGQHTF
jgi:hypothetical protein